MFEIKKLSCCRIFVKDVALSTAWYRDLFGVDPVELQNNFAAFDFSSTRFEIVLADVKNPFGEGGSVSYWFVSALDSVQIRALELGGKVHRGPLKVAETKSTIMQIQDPFGNVIGFESN